MRFVTFILTLLLVGWAAPDAHAQTEEPPAAEEPAETDEPTEESDQAAPGDESEGEDEGARPPTTKEDEGEEKEALKEDTEPIDTEPTMFTKCSHTDTNPDDVSWLLVALIAVLVRRRT
jgi:hypothetical protein